MKITTYKFIAKTWNEVFWKIAEKEIEISAVACDVNIIRVYNSNINKEELHVVISEFVCRETGRQI